MANEDGALLVVPVLVSLAASVGPTSFAAWVDQGPEEVEKIWSVYDSFVPT